MSTDALIFGGEGKAAAVVAHRATSGEVAAILGVSSQSVRNWASREGLPCVRGEDGGMGFELAAATAWIRVHKAGLVDDAARHGGKRRGAGRPSKAMTEAKESERALDTVISENAESAMADRAGIFNDPEKLKRAMASPEVMTAAEANRQRTLLDVAAQSMELEQARGNLLGRDEVEEAWTDLLVELRQKIETSSERMRDEIARLMGDHLKLPDVAAVVNLWLTTSRTFVLEMETEYQRRVESAE